MAHVDRPIGGQQPSASVPQMIAYLRRNNPAISLDEAGEIVAAYAAIGLGAGIDSGGAFAQACHETNLFRFGNQVHKAQHNPAGIGATNDGAAGHSWPTWAAGIAAHYYHLCAWARLPGGNNSIRYQQVTSAAKTTGYARTWRDLGGRWAVPGIGYGDGIERHWQGILSEAGTSMATPTAVTDRYIATLRSRGVAVTDLRGKLPINAQPANRYGLVRGGLGGVTKLIQHWTGDSFNRATLKAITGTYYGDGSIPATMSAADEIDLLTWYANYHIGRDGGTWGGIAYGTLVLPSGRVYVAWDIGTLTYHAFSVNGYSYALCCPASNGQAPTAAQLVALNHCWQVLCEETPEIPAGWGDLYGHTEARQFDAQNQTTCPGPGLLAHVRKARETGAPSVALPTQPGAGSVVEAPAPPDDPATWRTFLRDGRAILEIDFGGTSTEILGASVVDAGISTKNAAGEEYDRSILSNHGMPWRKRP